MIAPTVADIDRRVRWCPPDAAAEVVTLDGLTDDPAFVLILFDGEDQAWVAEARMLEWMDQGHVGVRA